MQLNISIDEYGEFPEDFDFEAFQAIWPRDLKRDGENWPKHWYEISNNTCRVER